MSKNMNNKELVDRYTKSEESGSAVKHFMYVPFTGLGLYNGFRGNRWLRNRIKIFKQFVIPSLLAQTCQDFTIWISWRPEEKSNHHVKELRAYLQTLPLNVVHTFSGCMFWDDKYQDDEARERLLTSIHGAMNELIDATEGCSDVYMTIQPSDDCYHRNAVKAIQAVFKDHRVNACGFTKGYMMNYLTKELAEYNPKTNPPFFTIKFPRAVFIHPLKHAEHTSIKKDVGKYRAGTPYPSHEYIGDALRYGTIDDRGFVVGTHTENISTVFDHPYRGGGVNPDVLKDFGLDTVPPLTLPFSLRRIIFRRLPYRVQRKLRFWAGEKKWVLRPLFSIIYNGFRD